MLKTEILKLKKEEINKMTIATYISSDQIFGVLGMRGFLGRGGFGCVRLGFKNPHGSVAIKCFPVTGSKEIIKQTHERLMNETRNTKLSSHENVVRLVGFTFWPGAAAIVMEYMPAGDLHTFLSSKNRDEYKIQHIPAVIRLRICTDVACGITYLHYGFYNDQRITHGDIKSENVLLTTDLRCKVSDFGGANFATSSNSGPSSEEQRKEFTYIFASPERLLNCEARSSRAMDVYSVSMISHEVLTRNLPFRERMTYLEVVRYVAEQDNRPSLEEVEALKLSLKYEADVEIINLLKDEMVKCWNQEPQMKPSMMEVRDNFLSSLSTKDQAVIARHVADITEKIHVKIPDRRQFQGACVPMSQFKPSDCSR